MRLLLSENLPLRTTKDLGDYVVDAVLPWRFGDLRQSWFDLLKLEDGLFFVADHPMTVTEVRIDKEITSGWVRELASDDAGHTWTVIRLAAPAPLGSTVSAQGTGYRSPTNGQLVENPADVVQVIEAIAGREGDWSQLRAECSRDGIVVAGSLDSVQTVQSWIHEVTSSVGAIWSADVKRLYPVPEATELVWPLEAHQVSQLQVSADAQETADVLRVGYDWSQADGRALHSITMEARPIRFEGKEAQLDLKWLRKARSAEVVTGRLLQRLASRRYQLRFSTDQTRIRPGHWVKLIAHPLWPFADGDPTAMVVSVVNDPQKIINEITAEVMYTTPTVRVATFSLALDNTETGAVDVAFKNGVATFTIFDDNGQPLVGARCALDGSLAKFSNSQGKVSFTTTRGTHSLVIEHELYNSQTLSVKL